MVGNQLGEDPRNRRQDIAVLDDPLFYLRGTLAMIDALRGQLLARGVAGDAIRTDEWE